MTVDPIAVKAKNFKPDEPMRIKAAILHVMSEAEGEGHLYLSCEQVLTRTGRLLNHKGADGQVTEMQEASTRKKALKQSLGQLLPL